MNVKTIILFLSFIFPSIIFAQNSNSPLNTNKKYEPVEPHNKWGLGVSYTEQGIGVRSGLYFKLSNSTNLDLNISISGVADSREFEEYDIFGNSRIRNKENRIYMIPLSIGIQHYLFADELDDSFRPYLKSGIAPTLVLTNPYSRGFFNALGYMQPAFAIGPYAGVGLQFKQSNSIGFNFGISYYYLPLVGKKVNSLYDQPIKDVGGLQFQFGVDFLGR